MATAIWQEVELLEELLTNGYRPNVVVFYDGVNDLGIQSTEGTTTIPSTLKAQQYARAIAQYQNPSATQPLANRDLRHLCEPQRHRSSRPRYREHLLGRSGFLKQADQPCKELSRLRISPFQRPLRVPTMLSRFIFGQSIWFRSLPSPTVSVR